MFAIQCRGEAFDILRISQMLLKDSNASPLFFQKLNGYIKSNSLNQRPGE